MNIFHGYPILPVGRTWELCSHPYMYRFGLTLQYWCLHEARLHLSKMSIGTYKWSQTRLEVYMASACAARFDFLRTL